MSEAKNGAGGPLVSIGLPLYNEEQHLRAALDSLLAQDYENFELVISDNASTDSTPQICAEYAGRDARVRYHRNDTNVGGVDNFNRVLELARGDYFMWASGHDVRHPSYLSRCLAVMEPEPSVILCHTLAVWIDDEGREIEPIISNVDTRGLEHQLAGFQVILWGSFTGFPIYGLMRTARLRGTRRYTHVFSPDVALLVEMSLLGKFAHVPEKLLFVRRPHDYGDARVYVEKHFRKGLSGWGARRLFWSMISEVGLRSSRHAVGLLNKAVVLMSVATCMLTKNRWMLRHLRSLGGGKS